MEGLNDLEKQAFLPMLLNAGRALFSASKALKLGEGVSKGISTLGKRWGGSPLQRFRAISPEKKSAKALLGLDSKVGVGLSSLMGTDAINSASNTATKTIKKERYL